VIDCWWSFEIRKGFNTRGAFQIRGGTNAPHFALTDKDFLDLQRNSCQQFCESLPEKLAEGVPPPSHNLPFLSLPKL